MLLFPSPSAEPATRFSPAPSVWATCPFFSAIIRLLVVISFLGKLLAEAFLEFSKPFWSACSVSGFAGGWWWMKLAKNMSVLSCATSLTSNFFSLQLCFYSLRLCWPTFLLSPCPTSVLQYCLCGSFLLFRRRCVLQSVLPLFSGCGDVFKVTLPFCLSL